MLHGETMHSPLPMDVPWWMADHFVFFGVLYAVLFVLCSGLGYVILKSVLESRNDGHGHGSH